MVKIGMDLNRCQIDHYSSGAFFPLFFFLLVLDGLLVSNGDNGAKFIFFSDYVRTMNDAAFTKFFPTRM